MLSTAWLAAHLADRSIRGIATETGALIRSGAIPVGIKLPPVREIAEALGVSPATVSAAWSELRRFKVIQGRGRTGMWVCGDKLSPRPLRFEEVGNFGAEALDLTLAIPDPALLPPLAEAMRRGAGASDLNSYQRVPIQPALRAAVAPSWPYRPEAFLATNGGYDALFATLHALIRPGELVAIEDPTAMRLLDLLDDLGVQVVPVACDAEGPLPAALAEALQRRPAAFLYQPRTHTITGGTVTAARRAEMARLLRASPALIIEDDGIGDLSAHAPATLAGTFPERTIHIRSYSKGLGPDLRLGILSASAELAGQIQGYRAFAAGWTSRILQEAAAWLLTDPGTAAHLAEARRIYAARRAALVAALTARGVSAPAGDGLSLWLPVRSEQFAMVTLAARGIAVLPGSKCTIRDSRHIRIGTSLLTGQLDRVADAIALVDPVGMAA